MLHLKKGVQVDESGLAVKCICVLCLEARVVHIRCFGTRASVRGDRVCNTVTWELEVVDGTWLAPLPALRVSNPARSGQMCSTYPRFSTTWCIIAAQRVLSLERAASAAYQLTRQVNRA